MGPRSWPGVGLPIIHCGERKCVACSLEMQTHLRCAGSAAIVVSYNRAVGWENTRKKTQAKLKNNKVQEQ